MRLKIVLLAVLTSLILTGCASPAQVGNMQAAIPAEQKEKPSALRNNLALDGITGGKGTNPLWTSQVSNGDFRQALEASLKSAGLLTDGKNGRYRLNAHLDGLRQPVFGASLTVSSKVHYVVLDTKTNRAIFEKTIDLPYTAALSDAFAAVKRLRLANEGAIRVNIEALINELISLDIADVEF